MSQDTAWFLCVQCTSLCFAAGEQGDWIQEKAEPPAGQTIIHTSPHKHRDRPETGSTTKAY